MFLWNVGTNLSDYNVLKHYNTICIFTDVKTSNVRIYQTFMPKIWLYHIHASFSYTAHFHVTRLLLCTTRIFHPLPCLKTWHHNRNLYLATASQLYFQSAIITIPWAFNALSFINDWTNAFQTHKITSVMTFTCLHQLQSPINVEIRANLLLSAHVFQPFSV